MFPALRPILNKGGAGRYISREESVERLMPIAEHHLALLRTYDRVLPFLGDAQGRARVDAMMPYLRTETAKVSETMLSLGAAPPSGAGTMTASTDATYDSDRERVQSLLDAEAAFGKALTEETDAVHHQERTRAILTHNAEASAARMDLLRGVLAELPR